MQLSGNTILITGGTSGIGKALALRFLELGNTVIITGRNQEALDLLKRKHTALFCFYADLSKQNDVKQLIQWGLDHFPQLNVVINNAGVQFNYIFDGSPEINRQTENEIAVNLTAPILINNGLIPLLLKQSDAAIVNVSSGLAIAPKKNGAVYCATKSGLHAYTLALRYQLENGPVRVFEIIPPLVDTAMTKGRGRGKISPDDLVHEFLNDFKKNKPESYIGKTKILKTIYRLWPSIAYRIMKTEDKIIMKLLTIINTFLFLLHIKSNAQNTIPKKIVFVMSSAQHLSLQSGKTYTTGNFLSEFYPVYKALSDSGYQIDLATLNGLPPGIDKESLQLKYWDGDTLLLKEAKLFISTNPDFLHPMRLDSLLPHTERYKGIIIPGGQGLMVDLMNTSSVKQILLKFSTSQSAIGLICHAPALLLSFPKAGNPFKGYRITSVSGFEEWYIEHFVLKGKPSIRKIGRLLNQHGLIYRHGKAGKNYALRDRNLVSSQNPFSNKAFLHYYFDALQGK